MKLDVSRTCKTIRVQFAVAKLGHLWVTKHVTDQDVRDFIQVSLKFSVQV